MLTASSSFTTLKTNAVMSKEKKCSKGGRGTSGRYLDCSFAVLIDEDK